MKTLREALLEDSPQILRGWGGLAVDLTGLEDL